MNFDNFNLDDCFDRGISIKYGKYEVLIAFTRWCGEDKYTLHRWIGNNLRSLGVDSENLNGDMVIKIVGVDEI